MLTSNQRTTAVKTATRKGAHRSLRNAMPGVVGVTTDSTGSDETPTPPHDLMDDRFFAVRTGGGGPGVR